jgi:hypothetical protein
MDNTSLKEQWLASCFGFAYRNLLLLFAKNSFICAYLAVCEAPSGGRLRFKFQEGFEAVGMEEAHHLGRVVKMVEVRRLELLTSSVQRRRSAN